MVYFYFKRKPDLPRIDELIQYLKNTWIGNNSTFKRELWNHWETESIRTNNICEGYNNRLNRLTTGNNPNMFKVIELFKREEALAANKLVKAKLAKFKKPITCQVLKNENLLSLKKDYKNGSYESNFDYLFDCFEMVCSVF